MKPAIYPFVRACLFAVVLGLGEPIHAQTATWTGASGGEWNTAGNWDIGVPGAGTNAVIPAASAVIYNNPMAAASFRTLTLSNALAVNTSNFVINEAGASSTVMAIASGGTLNIAANNGATVTNAGGAVNVANGGTITVGNNGFLLLTNSTGANGFNVGASGNPTTGGVLTIGSGATVTLDKLLSIAGVPSRVSVNGGTLNCLAGSRINENSNDGSQRIAVASGSVFLGDFSVARCASTGGLLLTNGVANATAIQIGTGNSTAYSTVVGGTLTNTGTFTISDTTSITDNSADRKSYFQLKGGTVVSSGVNGIIIANQSNASGTPSASGSVLGGVLNVSGGTLIAEKLTLIKDNTIVNAYASFTLSGGAVYLGSGGLVFNTGSSHIGRNLAFTGGTMGAKANWSSSAPFSLQNTVTFKAADPAGTPFNITLTGVITNTGSLTKTGGGVLTISGNNTYSGNTTINAGSLVLGSATALPKGTLLIIGSSGNAAMLDLAGFNVQISSLATAGTAASQLITNSSAANTSILTFSNPAANSTFGGVLAGIKPVALTLLGGNLTLSGQNSYRGNLLISSGKLTLSGAGSTFTGPTIVLSNSVPLGLPAAALDVSGMGGISLGTGQSLSGYGGVNGGVTAANCPVSPGAVGAAGTLTFSNNLALNGGVTNHFDLALDPNAAGNDLIVVGGALSMSGTNVIEISALGGTLSAGTYKLIKFGSLGGGGTNNFLVTGSPGPSLQATVIVAAAEIDLVVSATGGSQRLWTGDGVTNTWDFTSTNWLNSGSPDVYSDGKFVTFDDTGSSTPPVNLTTTLQPATVLVNAAANYTFSGAGKISGGGTLTKTNSGALVILTTNNYSGPTTINQGILQLGNGTNSGTLGTNVILNSGTLVLNLSGSNGLANVISGPGKLTQSGSGTLTLTASNTYSGGTTISNGTLQLNTGAWFGGGGVTNNGALIFNSSSNVTVAAVMSGTGAITLAGNSTVTVTGNNTYSGGTVVNKGTLLVNNSGGVGTGAITVASGATLSGNGVIGGAVTINSGGIFAPGNPTGTLTISNNFMANSGAVLNYTLGTSSDKTVVSGNVNLNGTLNITAGSGFTSTTYPLFTYGGTLTLGGLSLTLPANTSGTIDTNTPGLVNLVVGTLQTNIPAFPGALGFGSGATGARIGGTVYHVTTLADSGTGSFRDAVSKSGRIIVFDVGGYIALNSAVSAKGNLTIAGQTAPGGGIGFKGGEISFANSANIICRYLRILPGSDTASTGDDCLSLYLATNVIMDHVSLEFGPWNNIDAVGCSAITVQNSIDANPTGQQFGAHTESVGENYSWFYNVFANSHNRNPLAKINTVFINNINYNYSAAYTTHTSTPFKHDIVNNYFIMGPASTGTDNTWYQIDNNQSMYFTGNLKDNNLDGVLGGSTTVPLPGYQGGGTVLASPWSTWTTNVTVYSQKTAYRLAVSQAGALPRDEVDTLVISQMKTLGSGPTGTGAGTAGPGGGLYTSQTQTGLSNNGYGNITGSIAPVDTDKDGLPDYWELALGSNPNIADSLTPGTGGYTKLENYLNWLAVPHATAPKNSFVDVDLRQFTAGFTNASPVYSVLLPTNGTAALLADGHTAEFTAAGNFSGLGSFNFSVLASDGATLTNTVGVVVTATGLAQNLTWRGDGTLNNWDTTSTNWVNGTNRFTFTAGADTTFDDTGSNNPAINLVGALQPASVTVAANQNYTFGGSGALGGVMALSKDGAGTLTINNSNTFSGGTFVDGGTLTMGSTIANASGLGTNAVSLGDGTRLNLFDAGTGLPGAGTFPNDLDVSGSTVMEMPQRGAAGGRFAGTGTFNLITHYVRADFNYDGSAFTGTFNALTPDGGADFRMGSYSGFPSATVNLSNNINAYFISTISPSGNTVDFGQINAVGSAKLAGGPTGGRTVTLRIGGLGNDSSFAGAIVEQNTNSTTHLIKIGAGTLTLGGANSYSGQTIVSNGTLVVNGSTGTNLLTVMSGILGGNGAIGGGVALQSGNAISPGANINPGTIGTLTITNGATGTVLALTNATLYFDLANATNAGGGVNDLISLAGGALVLSGTNTIMPNLLSGFLAPGNYTLISGGSATSGGAANLVWAGAGGTRQAFSFDTTSVPGTVFLVVAGSPPASLVWTGTNGGAWNVNGTVNWLNAGTADKFFDLDSAIFNDTSTNGNVVMTGAVQPGQVVVSNSVLNYSLGGAALGGVGSLVKNGSGVLTLGGSNSFRSGTFINGGAIILSNDVANQFGLGTGAVTLNGGTLTMHDDAATANVAYWNVIVPANATGTLNVDSRCDLFGSLTGGGTFNFSVPSVNTTLYGDWSAFTGTVNVMGGGDFRVNNPAGYPAAAIVLSNNVNCYFSDVVDPNGTALPIGALSGTGSSSLLGGATAANVFTWQIGGQNTDATFAGTIAEQNTNAITAIEKIGTGTWTLTGNNTFSGDLTVSAGTLSVNNTNGSATGTNQLFVATGATLSGSGSIGGLTVFDDGATLAPGNPSGTLTINNELDLSDLTVLQFGLGTNSDEVVVAGDLNLDGQLNITDTGGFGTGTYTLFSYGGIPLGAGPGNFTIASAPAGFIYTISTNIPGQINLIVTRPQFNAISVGSNGIVMSGSGGPANGTFYLLGSTNVASPLNLWLVIATNQFDASGNFNFTNSINSNTPQSFYRLQLP